jgi:hypothetical protein
MYKFDYCERCSHVFHYENEVCEHCGHQRFENNTQDKPIENRMKSFFLQADLQDIQQFFFSGKKNNTFNNFQMRHALIV